MSLMWWLGPVGAVTTVLGFGWDSNRASAGVAMPGGSGNPSRVELEKGGGVFCPAWPGAFRHWSGSPLLPYVTSITRLSS